MASDMLCYPGGAFRHYYDRTAGPGPGAAAPADSTVRAARVSTRRQFGLSIRQLKSRIIPPARRQCGPSNGRLRRRAIKTSPVLSARAAANRAMSSRSPS
ncbi:hypothetical protein GCM10009641_62360 [Mycobacterium cookii]